ncbi:hypothetical protein CIG75_14350 [Tumebacillus algifaecis]|uniref:Uncharacterized protein n=1 Tax=Tumebacillus algifaecis TaxID=1214604 RepID=A0A223D3M2_9BACL|nr:hypothetical protein CIG75_14350 [Tumebacillus algifaecis]
MIFLGFIYQISCGSLVVIERNVINKFSNKASITYPVDDRGWAFVIKFFHEKNLSNGAREASLLLPMRLNQKMAQLPVQKMTKWSTTTQKTDRIDPIGASDSFQV